MKKCGQQIAFENIISEPGTTGHIIIRGAECDYGFIVANVDRDGKVDAVLANIRKWVGEMIDRAVANA